MLFTHRDETPITPEDFEYQRLYAELHPTVPSWWRELADAEPCQCQSGYDERDCHQLPSDGRLSARMCRQCKNITRHFTEG